MAGANEATGGVGLRVEDYNAVSEVELRQGNRSWSQCCIDGCPQFCRIFAIVGIDGCPQSIPSPRSPALPVATLVRAWPLTPPAGRSPEAPPNAAARPPECSTKSCDSIAGGRGPEDRAERQGVGDSRYAGKAFFGQFFLGGRGVFREGRRGRVRVAAPPARGERAIAGVRCGSSRNGLPLLIDQAQDAEGWDAEELRLLRGKPCLLGDRHGIGPVATEVSLVGWTRAGRLRGILRDLPGI